MSTAITVEVVYALTLEQDCSVVELPCGSSVKHAIERAGVLERHAEIDARTMRVGVWGRPVGLDQSLEEGDRVEIYRPLRADPKEVRRSRAAARRGKLGG
jgi:uncharacterized protein